MHICYLDESGDGVTLTNINLNRAMLAFGLVGIIIDADKLESVTNEYIDLKRRYFPGAISKEERHQRGNWAKLDIKGCLLYTSPSPRD